MPTSPWLDRLAVCSWSLQPADPAHLLRQLQATGLNRVQLALDPLHENPEVWGAAADLLAANGVIIVSGMFGPKGEDYSSLESIRRTGGLTPDETWDENWRNIRRVCALAKKLDLKLVTFHAGFLPEAEEEPAFARLFDRLCRVADLFEEAGIDLGLETGQETAETLRAFLEKLNRSNVGVNFDPANMILYDKGESIVALRTLAPWLKQCHVKDANRTKVPGAWGEEVVVGTGQVDWTAFFGVLAEIGFAGNLCVEREAGDQRVADIRSAREYVARFGSGVRSQQPAAAGRGRPTNRWPSTTDH